MGKDHQSPCFRRWDLFSSLTHQGRPQGIGQRRQRPAQNHFLNNKCKCYHFWWQTERYGNRNCTRSLTVCGMLGLWARDCDTAGGHLLQPVAKLAASLWDGTPGSGTSETQRRREYEWLSREGTQCSLWYGFDIQISHVVPITAFKLDLIVKEQNLIWQISINKI